MAADLDPSVVSSVVNANFKTIAETPALLANQFMSINLRAAENAVDAQQQQRLLSNTLLTAALKRVVESDIMESVAARNTATADLPNRITDDGSANGANGVFATLAVAIAQALAKVVQTVPPVTVPPPAAGLK